MYAVELFKFMLNLVVFIDLGGPHSCIKVTGFALIRVWRYDQATEFQVMKNITLNGPFLMTFINRPNCKAIPMLCFCSRALESCQL